MNTFSCSLCVIRYKLPTSSMQHECHSGLMCMYFWGMRVQVCTCMWPDCIHVWIVYVCPRTVIHTHVYYYKVVACADSQACVKLTIWMQIIGSFSYLLHHNLLTVYTMWHTKIFFATAEFNGLSSAIYIKRIIYSELKILVKIRLRGILHSHGWFLQAQSQLNCIV